MMTDYQIAVRSWKDRDISNAAELAEALNGLSVLLAYHSGKIENDSITYHDTREIFEHDGVTSYTGDLRTLFEIRNAKEAYELFLTAFNERRPVDGALVKEFHFKLTQNTYDSRRFLLGERPGEYKLHDYVTGKEEIGAAPEDVAEKIDKLLGEVRDIPEDKLLTAAAYFHAKFEIIHPFADGNGRVGRLLTDYLLVLNGHPPIVIFEEDRRGYYDALEAWDSAQELAPMISFLEEQAVKTWRKRIEKEKKKT